LWLERLAAEAVEASSDVSDDELSLTLDVPDKDNSGPIYLTMVADLDELAQELTLVAESVKNQLSPSEVVAGLKSLPLEKYAEQFVEAGIDSPAAMTEDSWTWSLELVMATAMWRDHTAAPPRPVLWASVGGAWYPVDSLLHQGGDGGVAADLLLAQIGVRAAGAAVPVNPTLGVRVINATVLELAALGAGDAVEARGSGASRRRFHAAGTATLVLTGKPKAREQALCPHACCYR
jgi:hypothetical protein